MKDFQDVNSKISYTERHLSAVNNEVTKLSSNNSSEINSSEEFSRRYTNIEKHLKEVAKELYEIRELLASLDNLHPEHEDSTNKYKIIVETFKKVKIGFDSLKSIEKTPAKTDVLETELKKTTLTPEISEESVEKKSPIKDTKAPADKEPLKENPVAAKEQEDAESFIGTKVISIVGILLMILGIGYGAKYAIENNLISPKIWIIAIYIFGTGLLIAALKLKSKYENFSAVLLSGAMAIYYFTTYFAFAHYDLLSREIAFGMMLIFTVFTVIAALRYDNQIIAHIGFVGAYAVPFLVRGNNDNIVALFSFMTIINVGILAVAIKKNWQSLIYAAFFLTWLIFGSWFLSSFHFTENLQTALIFVSAFFVIFYITILAYKLTHSKMFDGGDIVLIILNSVVFYSIGYAILQDSITTKDYLGLFTFLNGALHIVVNLIIKRFKEHDKNLHYLTFGMALAFVTIAIPVEFNGSWLALFWLAESAVLFWIGRNQKVKFYEIFSYPLLGVALISLFYGWGEYYSSVNSFKLFQSVDFLISMLFIGLLIFILIIENKTKENAFNSYGGVLVSVVLSVFYFAFFLEISNYWNLQIKHQYSILDNWSFVDHNYRALSAFRNIWLTNYTLLYLAIISWANIKFYKNQTFAGINLIINAMAICLFLTVGLYNLSFTKNFGDFGTQYSLRYSSILILGFLLFTSNKYISQPFTKLNIGTGFSIATHVVFLWVLTSELFNWSHLTGTRSMYKLGLSLLWSLYGFTLILYGIWQRKKYLRIMSFIIFGLVILKLFFYDIAHQPTIYKTIVMMSLGLFLLIVSFLYNKYIGKILKEENEAKEGKEV